MADALAAWSEKQKQSRQSTVGSTLSSFVGGGSSASTSADLEAGVDADGDDGGFFGNIRSSVTRATGHHYNRLSTSVGESFDSVPSSDSMQWFGLLLAVGGISMAISFMFLPMVVVSPQKFALLFALGSGSLIASTVVLRGPKPFFEFATAPERIKFSVVYFLSFGAVLYFSLVSRSYFFTIASVVAQIASMLYMIVSYLPGGTRFLNTVFGTMWSAIKFCFRQCCKFQEEEVRQPGWFG